MKLKIANQPLRLTLLIVAGLLVSMTARGQVPPSGLKFSFGPRPLAGHTQVAPGTAYTPQRGYGFDLGSRVELVERGGTAPAPAGGVTGSAGRPFFFSAKLPVGAYRVSVTLGDPGAPSTTTVKSESRRLMLEAVHTAPGELAARSFLVHLRVPQLPDGTTVRLKPRERDPILAVRWDAQTSVTFTELDWDKKLTLEFSGERPALCAVEIAPCAKPVTVYVAGDSTVSDWAWEPWNSWGQMLPRWFREPVLIANYAEPGETTASFVGERRWPKLMSTIQPGDYLLIQFGHNDVAAVPLSRYQQFLADFIRQAREKGAIPILVTPMERRGLNAGKVRLTLRDYPAAMRQVAREQNVPLIDLNAMSLPFYEALGPASINKAFVDSTHHNDYGSYELAKFVVQGIIDARLPLAAHVVSDWRPIDPAHPDPVGRFRLPPDPQQDPAQPVPARLD